MQIADALRLMRNREGLTQTAACRRDGAPDVRTLSHWETGRKCPSFKLLDRYLASQGFDFRDLQDALDQVKGEPPRNSRQALRELEIGLGRLEERVRRLEEGAVTEAASP